jgi:zinc transport system substrate-binding protein
MGDHPLWRNVASEFDLKRLLILVAVVAAACSRTPKPEKRQPAPGPLTVYAVNYPLAYFAERLASDKLRVKLPAPPGVDPAYWRPSSEVVAQVQGASLILLNGAGYARWTRYATLPKSKTVTTTDGCRETFLPADETLEHRHGPEGKHAHEGTAFTTWLDLELALCQASHVRDALLALRPEEADAIRERYAGLERDLRELDARLRAAGEAWGDRPILASHPVYQYLADAYALSIESLHFEPDQALGADELAALDARLKTHRAKLMLWEAEPRPETRRELERRGIEVIVFDPVSGPPENGDFVSVMRENAVRLACASGAHACE